VEIIESDRNGSFPLVILGPTGGSSAVNLINRFCHSNADIEKFVATIIKKEKELIGPDKIIAEIVHLPESRIGNILYRPALREYEIPYLAKESVEKDFRIPITDLFISTKDGKNIILKSRRLDREIIPRLSTAHNFFTPKSLPIYHFLCSIQTYEFKGGVSFSWGATLESSNFFFPRVQYKNVIFSLARWKFKEKHFGDLPKKGSNDFSSQIEDFRKKYGLPSCVSLIKGDNKLTIDFASYQSAELFVDEVKKSEFELEEVIEFNKSPLITDENKNVYKNEIVFGFYKKL